MKTEIKVFRGALFHIEARVSLKYFVNGFLWKHFFASNLPWDSFKPIFFDSFENSKTFHTILTKNHSNEVAKEAQFWLTL